MVCKVNCVVITGIEVQPVIIETDVSNGLPSFDMVGLLASDIKEARERVRTAIKNSGFMLPPKRITINFSPANMRKTGTYFDLPVAMSILQALGLVQCEVEDKLFVGELSLDGKVIGVNGVLPIVLCAMEQGIKQCFVPMDNVGECDFIEGMDIVGVESLNHLVKILIGGGGIKVESTVKAEDANIIADESEYDFCNVFGQAQARKAAEISAAGIHNFLMIGPPGTGKSIIAKTLPSILPDMLREEKIEISKIQSIAGNLRGSLVNERPIRSPHHTVTVPAMIGGGMNPKPGEITLANGGVLFMDEFPEFSRKVLETLRQPLEEGKVVVSRTGGTFTFPANFILLAAMNPCRCGYYPDRNKCECTERDVKKYLEKVSGPILDRMDLCVHMNPVPFYELNKEDKQESSKDIRRRVNKAVEIQRERYKSEKINFNSQLEGNMLEKYCHLDKKERELMEQIYYCLGLSVRAYGKVLKVARTIADLKEKEKIGEEEIGEAVSFRVKR